MKKNSLISIMAFLNKIYFMEKNIKTNIQKYLNELQVNMKKLKEDNIKKNIEIEKLKNENNRKEKIKNIEISKDNEINKEEIKTLKEKLAKIQKELESEKQLNLKLNEENKVLRKKEFEYEKKQKDLNIEINQLKELFNKRNEENKNIQKDNMNSNDLKLEQIIKENKNINQIQNNQIISSNEDNYNIFIKNENLIKTDIIFEFIKKKESIKDKKKNSSNTPILIGQNDIGGFHFMNAVLQCLSQTKILTDYFLDEQNNNEIINNSIAIINKNSPQLSPAYLKLIQNLWKEKGQKNFSPTYFKNLIEKMCPNLGNDSHFNCKDLLLFILEQMHKELNKQTNNNNQKNIIILNEPIENKAFNSFYDNFIKETSIIKSYFYGVMEDTEECLISNINDNIFYKFRTFNSIIFELEEFKRIKKNNITIDECFKSYICNKIHTEQSKNLCNICNGQCYRTFNSQIFITPYFLILILDRGKGKAFDIKVNFNENLDISNYVKQKENNQNYKLYAVITQIDKTGEKFAASCKSLINNEWNRFNDSEVKPIINFKNEVIKYETPIILFYSKINSK